MFDIDGTLLQSNEFDSECYKKAVYDVIGIAIDDNWSNYKHVTDAGILNEIIHVHDLNERKQEIHKKVKKCFIKRVDEHLKSKPAQEVLGAATFLARLREMNNVVLSIATGGWLESAVMKLNSAGINIQGIPVASSDDHYCRVEIMKTAQEKATKDQNCSNTYFGDGTWDKKACSKLSYNFVLVGNSTSHYQSIVDYCSPNKALEYIGL